MNGLLPRRFIVLALLLTGWLVPAWLGAQTPAPAAAAPRHATRPTTYRIVIFFTRAYHGKPRADRSYTLLATVGETLPAIRDDVRYRTDEHCTDPLCVVTGATDVDLLSLKPHGRLVTVGLRFSLQTIGNDTPDFLPKLAASGTHQYLVSPTVAVGKRTVVYQATDTHNATDAEVQLLIEPFDPENPGSQTASVPSGTR